MSNYEHYLIGIEMLKNMKQSGILTEDEYSKVELFLCKKYCIKKVSMFRTNNLIQSPFRVMNVYD